MSKQRRPLIAGNWKLHYTVRESVAFAKELKGRLASEARCDVMIAPVFTALHPVADALAGSRVGLGAQDCYFEDQGAFTGEVSAKLIADVGCRYAIIGHSERRQLFGETDGSVRKKAASAFDHDLIPVVCVGETLAEREQGRTLDVVLGQLRGAFEGTPSGLAAKAVIAYEPVWAIGTGKNAQPSDAQAVHAAIRTELSRMFGTQTAEDIRILYGGSVKPDNAKALMREPDIDGALVGGASLKTDSFMAIVQAVE